MCVWRARRAAGLTAADKFTNRSKDMLFTRACVDAVRDGIARTYRIRASGH